MADATVNIKVTDVEPFKRFVAKVAEAYIHFYGMSIEEAKALPDRAARGYMMLQAALDDLGVSAPSDKDRQPS